MDNRHLHVLGITGNVGCGKSTLLQYMEQRWHARILELDKVAAELEKRGGACYGPLLSLMGPEVLREDGEFDRGKVAERIFGDDLLRAKVNEIVHPAVKGYVLDCIAGLEKTAADPEASVMLPAGQTEILPGQLRETSAEKHAGRRCLLVIEAALLYEGGYDLICEEIWYVYTEAAIRALRLKASRGYSDEKIRAVMAAQKDDVFFRERADAVIDNSDEDLQTAYRQVDREMLRFLRGREDTPGPDRKSSCRS